MRPLCGFVDSIFSGESRDLWLSALSRCKKMPFNLFCGSMSRYFAGYPESHVDGSTENCISSVWSMQLHCRFQIWPKWSKSYTFHSQFLS
jgi:hypothetical protein